jgi:uncharacterized protein YjdB
VLVPSRHKTTLRLAASAALAAVVSLAACGETLIQVTDADVAELRMATDSAKVGIGREVQLRVYPLDAGGGLLIGPRTTWRSDEAGVAMVDQAGLVSGVAVGTTNIVAELGARADTTVVTVDVPPLLVLAADSVGFEVTAGGADPPPESIGVSNGGGLALSGLRVDSTTYAGNTSGWLSAQLSSPVAPSTLQLTANPAGITAAGVYTAFLWMSATDADGSPVAVTATLEVAPGAPLSSGFQIVQGNGQTAVVGESISVAPTISLIDEFDNPVAGATVNFTASGGGTANPATVMTDANGQASTIWTLSTSGHTMNSGGAFTNTLTAAVVGLTPLAFTASAVYSFATHVNGMWAASACTGCHGGAAPFLGLPLDRTAAENHAALTTNAPPVCDATLTAYRRVRIDGGDDGHDFSVLRIFMEPSGDTVTGSGCGPHGFAKVNAANLAILRAWIRNGAPNN